jgi:hypothetical protein
MRGSIRRRGKASWELKFDVASSDGKRKTRYATVRGARQDAQRELARLTRGHFLIPQTRRWRSICGRG